jgi:hypothetical protein
MPIILATLRLISGGSHGLMPAQANTSQDPISKVTTAKWTGGVAQAVEHQL